VGQLTTANMSEAAGSCGVSLEDGVFEGLLRFKFGLCIEETAGEE
jgi:hypothetical protein